MDTKICPKCKATKELSDFYRRSDTGRYMSHCKECVKSRRHIYNSNHRVKINTRQNKYRIKNIHEVNNQKRQHYKLNRDAICETNRRYRESNIETFLSYGYINCRSSSTRLRRTFTISYDYILELYHNQNGKCAATGLELSHKYHNLYSASIDRIDSDIGYVNNNIQIICKAINLMKRNYTNENLLEFLNVIRSPAIKCEAIIPTFLNRLFIHCVGRSKRDHRDITISKQHLIDSWNLQNGKCAISGIPMSMERHNLRTVSPDRKDHMVGYSIGNTQLVCQGINLMKNKHTDQEAIEFINALRC